MSANSPEIVVIVVNYNGGEHLPLCLQSLQQQTRMPGDVIVVDNASSDGSVDSFHTDYPSYRLLPQSKNLGFAEANNIAVESINDTSVKWIALLNPDAIAPSDWIEKLHIAIRQHTSTDMFSCRLVNSQNSELLDGTGDHYHVSGIVWRRDHGTSAARTRRPDEAVFSPCGAASVYRLDLFRQVGGFDIRYFCYNEDTDLAFRMRLSGGQFHHLDDCEVAHYGSAITGSQSDFSIYHGHRNLVWTYFKDMPSMMLWLYLPQHLLLNLVSLFYFTIKGKGGVIFRAKRDAIKGLPAILKSRRNVQKQLCITNRQLKQAMLTNPLAPYLHRYG